MKKRYYSWLGAAALFSLFIAGSAGARSGALRGIRIWGEILVPSLLPFFVSSGLLVRLGFTAALGRALGGVAGRLFRVGPAGAGVFLLGLSGGYPMGAAAAAEEVRCGRLTSREAGRLLRFCDNTGPAFAVGALGSAVFGSAGTGLFLWGIHALSAGLVGVLFRGKATVRIAEPPTSGEDMTFSEALTGSVSAAVSGVLGIGGFVVFISALLGAAEGFGFPDGAALRLSALTGTDPAVFRAFLTGALELSSGVSAMRGLPPTPASLALGSLLLGWGGLCVHFQAAAVTAGTGIALKERLYGKLLHALLSAILTWILSSMF